MHLRDLLKADIPNFLEERLRLKTIFEDTAFRYTMYSKKTLKEYLAPYFLTCKVRGTYSDVDDFLRACSEYWNTTELDGLLFYCEVIANIIYSCSKCIRDWDGSAAVLKEQCLQNIDIILEKTGYTFMTDSDGIIAVVKKDALAFSVIEDIDDSVTANAVLEYNRLDMKGDLRRKKGLLKQIGDYLEPTLQRRNAVTGKLFELADDVSFCLNSLDIRHNNKEGVHKKPLLDTLTDAQLEELYDDTYRSMLLLIETLKQEESHRRIEVARQECKGTK